MTRYAILKGTGSLKNQFGIYDRQLNKWETLPKAYEPKAYFDRVKILNREHNATIVNPQITLDLFGDCNDGK